jgi:LuxR family transcriptional regulator, maltose regulon positive regulatory protein
MLVRRRLLERLRARWYAPVTVVSAPAGYGKTTLLSQAIATNAMAPLGVDCWLACEPDDATASSLGEGLAHAVGAAPSTRARGAGPEAESIAGLAGAVGEAMWRRSPQQVSLIVDDVHEIPSGSDAAALLSSIVDALPANGHIVLAGRGPPPVPLARLDVEGRAARLDVADLAFTEDEMAEFAALRGVPGARVATCGGWPALAELSATARSGVTADYVGQEVLSGLPAARRRDLALLAHVGPFDDDLARAVIDPDLDLPKLVAGLPLVTAVPSGERSLHALWRSLLADEVTPAEVADARRRAAAAHRARGRADAAARLLIDAEAWDELGEAIVDVLGAAHPPVPRDVLAEWFSRLPADVRTTPSGRLLAAVVAVEADPEGAAPRLEDAAAEFRAAGHLTGELACLVQLGLIAWWSESLERLAALAVRVFQLEAAGCDQAVPLACLGRALVFDVQNDSRQVLTELDRIPPGSLNDVWQGVVSWLRSTTLMHLGDAHASLVAAEHALVHAGPLHAPLAEGARLQALWFQGRGDVVAAALPALVERMRQAGYRNYTSLAAAQCCLVHALVGQSERAADHLALARAAGASPDAPLVDTDLAIAEAALAVAEGDEAAASAVLTAYLTRQPLGEGHSAAPQQRSLALFYVLVAATRPAWDRAELGPAFVVARDLARGVVALRDDRRLPPDAPPLPDATIVRAHLPLRWAAELGVAAIAAGREDGWQLLDGMWPAARPEVADLARHATGALRQAARAAVGRLAVPPTGRLELRLLGPVELRRDEAPVQAADWRRERVRSLLAYLALAGTVSRGQLADELWPALDPEAQSRNLRVTLTYLLRVLEPDRAQRDASFFVRQEGGNLSLHPGESLTVDVWEFDALCERAGDADRRGSPSTALDHALGAVDLWRGEPTELVSEPWAVPVVEQRRLRFAAVATRAGELLLAHGDAARAQSLAERALAIDPWLESAHRLVVAAHRATGDDLAARRALGRYREAIADLGLGPDEATLMVERLLDSAAPGSSPLRAG